MLNTCCVHPASGSSGLTRRTHRAIFVALIRLARLVGIYRQAGFVSIEAGGFLRRRERTPEVHAAPRRGKESMATTRKATKPPPSPEARENVLAMVKSAPAPLNAAALTKLLLPPHAIGAKDLEPILEEFVAAGALLRLPGKTATGKPQYWDRDPASLRLTELQQELQAAEVPLTAQDLVKRVSGKPKAAELAPLLEELMASGAVFAMPASGAKAKPRYWGRPASEYGRQALRQFVEAKGPQEEAKLRKALKEFSDDQFRKIVDDGLAAKELFRHPIAGKVKKELLGTRPPSPEPYLGEVAAQLAKIVPRLLAANIGGDELRRYFVQIIEAAGVPFSSANFGGSSATQPARAEPAASGADLIGLIRRLEPGADRGALVGARDLRRASQLEKNQFDRAVLDLAREGRLSLHRHDYPTSLSPEERDSLISDSQGSYYVGVALKPG